MHEPGHHGLRVATKGAGPTPRQSWGYTYPPDRCHMERLRGLRGKWQSFDALTRN